MPNRPDKNARKAMLDRWRAGQRAAAREQFPLAEGQLRAMFEMLSAELPNSGCDHSMRLVRGWAAEQGLAAEAIIAWCHGQSGFCDCEVLSNCRQAFEEALRDVDWD